MMIKPVLITLTLGMAACAAGGSGSSQPHPAATHTPTSTTTSVIKLVNGSSYLLTQGEGKSDVVVPSQMPGTLELTLSNCFDSVTKGYFKDPQGQVFPFSQFGISLQAESRGSQGCKDTFVVSLPEMQEIAGTINFDFVQSGQAKHFHRPFSVVAKEKIKFEGTSPVEPEQPDPNDKVEDDKCGGPCESLIADFMNRILDKETRIYSDVFARNPVASIHFTGSAQKGEFSIRSGSFVFDQGRYEIRQKRLVLSGSSGSETLEFAYLPIQDMGRPTPTPTLYAKEKQGLSRMSYYIW